MTAKTVKDIMIEEDCDYERANDIYIERQAYAFDQWKDRAKEEGTYHNPLIPRD